MPDLVTKQGVVYSTKGTTLEVVDLLNTCLRQDKQFMLLEDENGESLLVAVSEISSYGTPADA